eukprot:TRINITY_DN2770_c1_g1_i1.p1 TRINITY_DN2770_c1_g1~~TRINITY_DN2770_c1_g1_i1.p1  ORF type:complete len:472 (-),score=62.01 TRINITY_DN2770_c1_g1_i1:500-1720(-)
MSYSLPLTGSLDERRGHAFGGMWNGRLTKGRVAKNRLQVVCQGLCIGQVVLGLVAAYASSMYLYSFLQTSGQIISVFLVLVGVLGFAGSLIGNKALLTSHMVAITLAMMIAYDFNAQVTRDTFVDCSLAELFQRNRMLTDMVKQNQKNELMTQIFLRLNEMEDLISMSHESSVAAMQIKQEQEGIKTSDIQYVREKLEMMKEHAQHLIDDLVNNPNITKQWVSGMSEKDKEILNKRIEAAENVLDKVEALSDPKHRITLEEYSNLLISLTEAFQIQLDIDSGPKDTSQLIQALNEMDVTREAYQRLADDKYHEVKTNSQAAAFLESRQKDMEERRKKWQDRFVQELRRTQKQHDVRRDALADLPEHCLMEESARNILAWSALGIVTLQLSSGICVLTLLFSLPKKD